MALAVTGGPEGPASDSGRACCASANWNGPGRSLRGPRCDASQPGQPAQAAAPEADPSASEPDPLGFAELPPVTPPLSVAPPAGPGSTPRRRVPRLQRRAGPGKAGGSADRKQWKTNFAAFTANISVGSDPSGEPLVDWGELRELREINDIVVASEARNPPARSPEAESPAAISAASRRFALADCRRQSRRCAGRPGRSQLSSGRAAQTGRISRGPR